MHKSKEIEKLLFEFCSSSENKASLISLCNCNDIFMLQSSLSDLFYNNNTVIESTKILKAILKSIEINKPDHNTFLKGISRYIKNPLSPLYEHAVILTASLYKDPSFNFKGFTQLDAFKDSMPSECFKTKSDTKLRSKFDSKIKIENDLTLFSRRNPINYLQEGIQYIKDENRERISESFAKMKYLIEKSSNRLLKFKCQEYFNVILSYDGFDLVKSDILFTLTNKVFDKLHTEIINLIFGDKICLRFKICLLNVLVNIVESESCDVDRIRLILQKISIKISEQDKYSNSLILFNLKHLMETCQYKLN